MTQKKNSPIVGKDGVSKKVAQRIKFNKSDVEKVIEGLLEEIKNSLIKEEEVRFLGYFSFKTVTQKARTAVNLQTKKKMMVPAKRVPKVKFSAGLKEAISGKSSPKKPISKKK